MAVVGGWGLGRMMKMRKALKDHLVSHYTYGQTEAHRGEETCSRLPSRDRQSWGQTRACQPSPFPGQLPSFPPQLFPSLTCSCSWSSKRRIGRSHDFPRPEEFPGSTHPHLAGPCQYKRAPVPFKCEAQVFAKALNAGGEEGLLHISDINKFPLTKGQGPLLSPLCLGL